MILKKILIKVFKYLVIIFVLFFLFRYAWEMGLVLLTSLGVSLGVIKKAQNPISKEEQESLEEEIKDWKERLDKFRKTGMYVIILLFLFASISNAYYIPKEPKRFYFLGKMYVEESYYLEMKELYLNACRALDDAEEKVDKQQEVIRKQNEWIEQQLIFVPNWKIIGGIVLSESVGWKLGVGKKYKLGSWNAGLIKQEKIGIYGEFNLEFPP